MIISTKTSKKLLSLFIFLSFSTIFFAQVGINTTTIGNGALLDVTDSTKGVLIPRVDIIDLSTIDPITGGGTESLLVYNNNTTTGPGFFYWNGSIWIGIDGDSDWKTDGNAGTNPGTGASEHFLGTVDDQDLIFARNSIETIKLESSETVINDLGNDVNLRVETTGDVNTLYIDGGNDNIGIGTATPLASNKLEVNGGANDAIFGYTNNVGGYLGRESNVTFGTPAQTILGAGVYANNPFAGYTSMYSQSTGAATVAASINYSDVWIASYNYVENSRATYNPGAVYAQLNNTGGVPAYRAAIFGTSSSGNTATSGGIDVGVRAQSSARNDNTLGMLSVSFSDTGATGDNSGGYFSTVGYSSGLIRSQTWIANSFLGTDYKVIGSGTVSTIIEDENDDKRIMFAPEAPEVLFQDFGVGSLRNGQATIVIDPILSRNIIVDSNHPLKVFIQLEGDCNGVYVSNKSSSGFTVNELQSGNSNIDFSWQIVASRADRKDSSNYGESKFQDLRFPLMEREMPTISKDDIPSANSPKEAKR